MCPVSYGESTTMICVFVLQNIMDDVEGPTGSYSATCVTCDDDDGTEEVSMKGEDAIDIMGEFPESISIPPIKTEEEVRFGVCVSWWLLMLLCHFWPQRRKTVKLHLTICCFVLYCLCHILFEI